jgi:hypothetical protein
VKRLLSHNVPDLLIREGDDQTNLTDLLSEGSCIVLGSPAVNPLTDQAIHTAFAARPDNSGSVPIVFVDQRPCQSRSSLVTSAVPGLDYGIYVPEEDLRAKAHVYPAKEFYKHALHDRLDAALILVKTLQLSPGIHRKLIVLAGVTRIGTLGAAHALVSCYRDLEPLAGQELVWGLIEGRYDKDINCTDREYRGYRWLIRMGGRDPLLPKKKKSAASEHSPSADDRRRSR